MLFRQVYNVVDEFRNDISNDLKKFSNEMASSVIGFHETP
jgi:hypothetical protein